MLKDSNQQRVELIGTVSKPLYLELGRDKGMLFRFIVGNETVYCGVLTRDPIYPLLKEGARLELSGKLYAAKQGMSFSDIKLIREVI